MKSKAVQFKKQPLIPEKETGIAMVMALLMGMVLVAGATGLMIRQMMARKLGAAESYNQLAESAALNGLNRIISDLNKDERDEYTGFCRHFAMIPSSGAGADPICQQQKPYQELNLSKLHPVERYIGAYPQGTDGEAEIIPINTNNIRADGIEEEIQ